MDASYAMICDLWDGVIVEDYGSASSQSVLRLSPEFRGTLWSKFQEASLISPLAGRIPTWLRNFTFACL